MQISFSFPHLKEIRSFETLLNSNNRNTATAYRKVFFPELFLLPYHRLNWSLNNTTFPWIFWSTFEIHLCCLFPLEQPFNIQQFLYLVRKMLHKMSSVTQTKPKVQCPFKLHIYLTHRWTFKYLLYFAQILFSGTCQILNKS